MSDIQVFYFPMRGKGELIRLLLRAAGQPFDDNTIDRGTWGPNSEAKKASPYGQLPYVIYKGKKYAQSLAIASFFARKFGLSGKTEDDELQVDEIIHLVDDARPTLREWYMSVVNKEEEKKAEAVRKAKDEGFPRFFGYFEDKLVANGATGFFVGDSVTLADLVVYDYLDTALGIDPDCLAVFPSLQKLRANVQAHPNLQDYLANRTKTDI